MMGQAGRRLKNAMYTKPLNGIDSKIGGGYKAGESALGGVASDLGKVYDKATKAKGGWAEAQRYAGKYGQKAGLGDAMNIAKDVLSPLSGSGYKSTGAGMLAGGAYGAMSDDTSVVGGMAMGGAAGFASLKAARGIHNRYGSKATK